jgi:hypothetical protein
MDSAKVGNRRQNSSAIAPQLAGNPPHARPRCRWRRIYKVQNTGWVHGISLGQGSVAIGLPLGTGRGKIYLFALGLEDAEKHGRIRGYYR